MCLLYGWLMTQGQQSSEEDIEEQGSRANRSSSMQVLLVRTVEKLLDGVCHRLKRTAWNVLLDDCEGHKALQVSMHISLHQPASCKRAHAKQTCRLSRISDATVYASHVMVQHSISVMGLRNYGMSCVIPEMPGCSF